MLTNIKNHQSQILHQLIGSLSHYLQSFVHPRWCRISSINSISQFCLEISSGKKETHLDPSHVVSTSLLSKGDVPQCLGIEQHEAQNSGIELGYHTPR